jgi:hypothetical protein
LSPRRRLREPRRQSGGACSSVCFVKVVRPCRPTFLGKLDRDHQGQRRRNPAALKSPHCTTVRHAVSTNITRTVSFITPGSSSAGESSRPW